MTPWFIGLASLSLAILTIAFRQRQLYLIIPRLFDYSPFSEKGRVIELVIINRSWFMEESLRMEMPPGVNIELLASDVAGVKLDNNQLLLDRLPQRTEAKFVFLVEGNSARDEILPRLTSKTSKGKLFKKESEILPNLGTLASAIMFFAITSGLFVYFAYQWSQQQTSRIAELDAKKSQQLATLKQQEDELAALEANQESVNSELRKTMMATIKTLHEENLGLSLKLLACEKQK